MYYFMANLISTVHLCLRVIKPFLSYKVLQLFVFMVDVVQSFLPSLSSRLQRGQIGAKTKNEKRLGANSRQFPGFAIFARPVDC